VLDGAAVQRRLEQVAGVSRVVPKHSTGERFTYEVESLKDRSVRADVARAVVESGWDLNELRSAAMTLEEVFLQLTGAEQVEVVADSPAELVAEEAQASK
jgi:ABC-2 type transport system ATP-binding protein